MLIYTEKGENKETEGDLELNNTTRKGKMRKKRRKKKTTQDKKEMREEEEADFSMESRRKRCC